MTGPPGIGAAPGPEGAIARGYDALRNGIGAYRLPRDVVAVRGPDAAGYLQGQVSQDLDPLTVGGSAPALLLQPDGKLAALVRVTRVAADGYVLDTEAGFGQVVADRLLRFRLRTKVDVEPLRWPCVALRGAAVPPAVESGRDGGPWELTVEWNGARGVDRIGPSADAGLPAGACWVPDAAWEALRVEAGIPVMGRELDDRTIAAEAGLVERAVSFTKGCYTGQELVARLDARGSRVARRLVGLVADPGGTEDPDGLVGASLWAEGRDAPAGRCTSAAFCPGVGAVGALGYLHRSVETPARLAWTPPGAGRRDPGGGSLEARSLPLAG